ncbi:MAG: damage-inducible protein DinB [Alphaproteobacteria bacterium]|nr:damage-inducible protein DinB [Alphaproteobacteria bacterium]
MITPEFVQTMAAYNVEMNRRLYEAAARLPDAERRRDRGAFWGSIHGTLNHILWADTTWMSRFDGWDKLATGIKQSDALHQDFFTLRDSRAEADRRISDWAGRVKPEWLQGELAWVSAVLGKEIRKSKVLLVTHFFNHQTHHRGQVHAMLTAAGEKTGDTDLPFIL